MPQLLAARHLDHSEPLFHFLPSSGPRMQAAAGSWCNHPSGSPPLAAITSNNNNNKWQVTSDMSCTATSLATGSGRQQTLCCLDRFFLCSVLPPPWWEILFLQRICYLSSFYCSPCKDFYHLLSMMWPYLANRWLECHFKIYQKSTIRQNVCGWNYFSGKRLPSTTSWKCLSPVITRAGE